MSTVRITTNTGNDQHSSWGAVGQVFVITFKDDVAVDETPIYKSSVAVLDDQEWRDGLNNKWCQAEYDIPDGTYIKLYAMSTRRGIPRGGGSMYFKVDAAAPVISAQGDHYQGRRGWVRGPLIPIPLVDLKDHGLNVPAKYKTYYKPGRIEVISVDDTKEATT